MTRIVITPPGRFTLPRPRELWEAREVLLRFGQRDVILRYRQTAVGVAGCSSSRWPLPASSRSCSARSPSCPATGCPYFLFSYVGMLAWNLFSGMVGRAAGSLVGNQALISKVFFPRMLVPLSTTLSVLVDFVVALRPRRRSCFYRVNPGWAILLLPFWAPSGSGPRAWGWPPRRSWSSTATSATSCPG